MFVLLSFPCWGGGITRIKMLIYAKRTRHNFLSCQYQIASDLSFWLLNTLFYSGALLVDRRRAERTWLVLAHELSRYGKVDL
jgi:hypothetical protein